MTKPNIDANTVLLLDLSGYIFRAYHAIAPLSTSKGFPTHAIFGVLNMLERLLRDHPDANIIAVKDAPGLSWRNSIYPDYKANRPETPADLQAQFEPINAIVDALGIPSAMLEGHEADDLLAGLALYFVNAGYQVLLLSADKDLLQLIQPNLQMWDPMRDTLFDRERVLEKWGVEPEQIPDLFALMGDSSDNVPGVAGIGPKRGSELIRQYGSLKNLLANVANLPKQKWADNIRNNIAAAELSYRLVRLPTELPPQVNPTQLKRRPPDAQKLRALFDDLEFQSQFKRLAHLLTSTSAQQQSTKTSTVSKLKVNVITDPDQLAQMLKHSPIAFDSETTDLKTRRAKLVGFSLAAEASSGSYIPLLHQQGSNADWSVVAPILKTFASDSNICKWGQNLKYDVGVLKTAGIELTGIAGDSLLASYLLNPDGHSHSLDAQAKRELGHTTIKFADVAPMGDFRMAAIADAANYATEDAAVAYALCQKLHPRLRQEGLWTIYEQIELPLVPVLAHMEWWGIRVNLTALKQLQTELQDLITKIEADLMHNFKRAINLQSPKQISDLLFEELKLPTKGVRKTKTGAWSTDVEVLENLQDAHPVVRKILEHRTYSKLLQTYVIALAEAVLPETGRIHPSFQQAVAATGRLACTDPNLQNIPVRDTWGDRIRAAFVPSEGYVFVGADYNQIELRVLAHFSGDPGLSGAFARGEDIHARTAADMLGLSLAKVTPEHRRLAKTINFGLMYGMGAQRLAKSVNISQTDAKKYIETYFERFAGVREFKEKTLAQAKQNGFVQTLFGRKRWLPDLNSNNKQLQLAAERAAINTPIQGTAADIMKLAMIAVYKRLAKEAPQARILLQVHDELLLEAPQEQAQTVQTIVAHEMENAVQLSVPLRVDSAIGDNWRQAH